MLTQFSPPTDNLYKFLSVLGIVLTASCFFGAYQQEERLLDELDELVEAISESKAALEQFEKTNQELNENVKAAIEAAKESGITSDQESPDEVKKALQEYRDFVAKLKDSPDESELGLTIAKSSTKRTVSYLTALRWLSWIFAFSTVACFVLWYKKYQKYNDKLIQLKIEYEENQIKQQKAKAES